MGINMPKSALIVCVWVSLWQEVLSCELIDERFMPYGEVLSVNNETMRGPAASLAYMMDALFARRQGDPVTVAVHIEVDQAKQSMTVTNDLSTSVPGKSAIHKISCEGSEWVYGNIGSTSAEGAYRAWDTRVSFKQIESGDIVVRRDERLVSGLIFKTREHFSAVSRFKRVGLDKQDGGNKN